MHPFVKIDHQFDGLVQQSHPLSNTKLMIGHIQKNTPTKLYFRLSFLVIAAYRFSSVLLEDLKSFQYKTYTHLRHLVLQKLFLILPFHLV